MKYPMRIILYPLLFILFLPLSLLAQETEFKASHFKDNKEGFKLAEEALKQGSSLVDKAISLEDQGSTAGQVWSDALPPLLKAQEFNPNYSKLNYLIARTLEGCGRLPEVESYARKAISLDPEVESYTYLLLARGSHLRLITDSALAFLSQYESRAKGKELEAMTPRMRKLRQEIDNARNLAGKPRERLWVDNIQGLNSKNDELMPNLPADAGFMLFNRIINSDNHQDIMMAERLPQGWGAPQEWLGGQFKGYKVIAIAQDGQEIFLSARKDGSEDIYHSELKGRQWSEPRKMPEYKINTEAQETHASFYFDRIKFYFVSDNDYANKGGKDIFFSGRINTSIREEWGKAHPMGSELNTPYDEGSVFMHPDGKTVYFASKGHNSMGGYDIFRSERLPGRWADPENLGYPINTPYDEIFFTIGPSGKHAYVCSNRAGGQGGFDIYRVTFLGPPKPNMVDYRDHMLSSMAEPTVERSLEASKEVDNVHLTILKGVVLDAFSGKPVEASIEITDNQKNELIAVFRSNSATGKFLVSLPAGKNYGIAVTATDYLFHSENFDLPENSEYQIVDKEIRLKNACIGCSIVLNNIFFDVGKHTLRPESTSELNRLAQLLKDIQKVKPATKVEISGHTDNTGSEATNLTLSGNRAKAVVDYLLTQGIPAAMLTYKGYGSGEPVASNATAAGRQQNRRTEFKIIE
jgi:outer membrane protein OmpA-like peptidoglycan-associated protein